MNQTSVFLLIGLIFNAHAMEKVDKQLMTILYKMDQANAERISFHTYNKEEGNSSYSPIQVFSSKKLDTHRCPVQGCESRFFTNQWLRAHKIKEHSYCLKCDCQFHNIRALYDHYKDIHFYCSDCNRSYENQEYFTKHNLENHSQYEEYFTTDL